MCIRDRKRREEILEHLLIMKNPVKGNEFSDIFNVSRQVIVQDIAVLRAEGNSIIATPQGYMISNIDIIGYVEQIVCKHHTKEEIIEELNIIVDNGGEILDVSVEHPIYGEFTGNLMIKSRLDVKNFIHQMEESKAEPMSSLNEGIHLHRIKTSSKDILEEIKMQLKSKGYLIS